LNGPVRSGDSGVILRGVKGRGGNRQGPADDHLPPPVEDAIHSLKLDVVTAEVVQRFDSAGIRSILLKGPALAAWLYEQEGSRSYSDCDLLVAPRDFEAAEQILTSLGFQRYGLDAIAGDWPKHARTWIRPDGVSVDLHRTFFGVGVAPGDLWAEVSRDTEQMHVGGVDVEVLRPVARALLVALHAAKDGRRVSKVQRDLALALDRVPTETWEAAADLADRLQATDAFVAGLRIVPSGGELAGRLARSAEVSTSLALRARGGAPPLSAGLNWLFSSPGWKGKFGLVARKLVPPRAYMWAWKPIARRGSWGLALAYVWRPLWVLWKVGPAVRAWLQARRKAAGGARPGGREPPPAS
jgi:hypothetical protein